MCDAAVHDAGALVIIRPHANHGPKSQACASAHCDPQWSLARAAHGGLRSSDTSGGFGTPAGIGTVVGRPGI